MKSVCVWLIQAETNIHVGNEKTSSIGLIDKEIQRNVLTGIPCINASSLKGAINEYATYKKKLPAPQRVAIFGVDKKENNDEVFETQKGGCMFFDANLLLLPVQDDRDLYKLVTSRKTLEDYVSLLKLIGISLSYNELIEELKGCDSHFDGIEGTGNSIVSFEKFKELCSDDELPIVARNCLIGKGNLWYEQVLPQKSIFGTIIIAPSELEVFKKEKESSGTNEKQCKTTALSVKDIDKIITDMLHEKVVQIGANATIGYGYCQFRKIKEDNYE